MAQLSITQCRQLARARREKGLTQSALAQAVGCKQSAVSMLESGQPEKLSQEAVAKIAALLGVELEAPALPASDLHSPSAAPLPAPGYCPSAECPSNVPYTVAGELLFWPRPAAAGGRHCAYCGEVLEHQCPHCGAALTEGACCHTCGGAKVTNTLAPGTAPEAWAAQRRREIAEWKALLA